MTGRIFNKFGEIEIDPTNTKRSHDLWLKKIGFETGQINYLHFSDISQEASEEITKFVLDLHLGRNLAKGTSRGRRSYNHLTDIRIRLRNIIKLLETRAQKSLLKLNENNVLTTFNAMRDGIILNKLGKPHLCVSTYAKAFTAFWKWLLRTKKKEYITLENIVENLDTSADRKPKWVYFTLQGLEQMALVAPSLYYKALIYFLFDSGIRAPKELMNVRTKDITTVPNTNYLFLDIREETSKTFGRKIKLMICSELLKQYINHYNKQPEDFLFTINYITTRRTVARMGYKIFKIGKVYKDKSRKTVITNGLSLYDFRHNSVCHYLPIYQSENQMKYRYGWKSAEMIHYYSEHMGMKDTITDEDMLVDITKMEIQQTLQKEQQKVALLQEQMQTQKKDMEDRMKELEKMLLQKFANT